MRARSSALCLIAAAIWLASSGHACHFAQTSAATGPAPEEACPEEGTDLTYENFGRPFLESHCQRCHATGADKRHGAPPQITFDNPDEVMNLAGRIYARAAAENTSMPPGPDDVPHEERHMLAEWLGCGAP